MSHTSRSIPLARATAAIAAAGLASLLAASGCARPQPHRAAAVLGHYHGDYGRATEHLELRPDYTFTQELSIDRAVALRHEGTWRLAGADIAFDRLHRALDPRTGQPAPAPAPRDNVRAFWLGSGDTRQFELVFDLPRGHRLKQIDDDDSDLVATTHGPASDTTRPKRKRPGE